MYDPYTHAAQLGLRVVWGDPGPGLAGIYHHTQRTAVIRDTMTDRAKRSTLAHEIVHHEYGDPPVFDPVWHAKREKRCDTIAAGRLITPEDLYRVRGIEDTAEWCRELDVLPWVIETYFGRHRHAA